MGRLKRKRNLAAITLEKDKNELEVPIIPFEDLPQKYLLMRVKSGTKIRNVLGYAMKEFTNHECIIWTGAGQAVGKVISCSELFKTMCKGLHQVTKLRYVVSTNSKNESTNGKERTRHIPEIHILLSKEARDVTVPGYQAPDDPGQFNFQNDTSQTESSSINISNRKDNSNSNNNGGNSSSSSSSNSSSGGNGSSNSKGKDITNIEAEKFAAMELIGRRKRLKKNQLKSEPPKKNKK